MKRLMVLSALIVLATFTLPTSPATAKDCGDVWLNGNVWWVGGSGMPCKKMRRWSRSMLLGKGTPEGWTCQRHNRGRNRSGGCGRGWNPKFQQPRWFWAYYPPD